MLVLRYVGKVEHAWSKTVAPSLFGTKDRFLEDDFSTDRVGGWFQDDSYKECAT